MGMGENNVIYNLPKNLQPKQANFTYQKIQVPFSMATGNKELMHKCFKFLTNTRAWKEQKNLRQSEEGKKRGMSMERSKAGMKKKSQQPIII